MANRLVEETIALSQNERLFLGGAKKKKVLSSHGPYVFELQITQIPKCSCSAVSSPCSKTTLCKLNDLLYVGALKKMKNNSSTACCYIVNLLMPFLSALNHKYTISYLGANSCLCCPCLDFWTRLKCECNHQGVSF